MHVICAYNGAAVRSRGRKGQRIALVGSRAAIVDVVWPHIIVVTLLAALSKASEHLLLEPPQPEAEDGHSDGKGHHQAPE
jgi:hypothetical protein